MSPPHPPNKPELILANSSKIENDCVTIQHQSQDALRVTNLRTNGGARGQYLAPELSPSRIDAMHRPHTHINSLPVGPTHLPCR